MLDFLASLIAGLFFGGIVLNLISLIGFWLSRKHPNARGWFFTLLVLSFSSWVLALIASLVIVKVLEGA